MLAGKNPFATMAPKMGGDETHGEVWWDIWLHGGVLDQLFVDAFAEFYPHRCDFAFGTAIHGLLTLPQGGKHACPSHTSRQSNGQE